MMKLLLLVSFLSLWRRGHETGAAVIKLVVKEGNDTILPCSLDNTNIKQDVFDWKKDKDQEVFLYSKGTLPDEEDPHRKQFKGRVSHFPGQLEVGNASIVIRDTKVTDSGNYTCIFPNPRPPTTRSNVELIVGASPKPRITSLEETKDWSVLRCEVHGAFPKPEVQWQNRAGDIVPAEEPQVSERGGSYDIILQATVTKTDHYRCVSTQKKINHQIDAESHVYVGGAAPKPFITTLGETAAGVQLQCEVHGAFPKPEVQWQNRAGGIVPAEEPQVSERGGRYDIILQATVTQTGYYRCVSTQKEINHQIFTETYVPDKLTGPLVGVSVAFALLLVGVFVYCVCVKRKKASNSGTERGAEHTNGSDGEERRLNDGMKSC